MFARIARRRTWALALAVATALAVALVGAGLASAASEKLKFDMVRSPGIVTGGLPAERDGDGDDPRARPGRVADAGGERPGPRTRNSTSS